MKKNKFWKTKNPQQENENSLVGDKGLNSCQEVGHNILQMNGVKVAAIALGNQVFDRLDLRRQIGYRFQNCSDAVVVGNGGNSEADPCSFSVLVGVLNGDVLDFHRCPPFLASPFQRCFVQTGRQKLSPSKSRPSSFAILRTFDSLGSESPSSISSNPL